MVPATLPSYTALTLALLTLAPHSALLQHTLFSHVL